MIAGSADVRTTSRSQHEPARVRRRASHHLDEPVGLRIGIIVEDETRGAGIPADLTLSRSGTAKVADEHEVLAAIH